MTTRQITYYKKLDSINSGDDRITLSQSLQFTSQSSRKKLKLVDRKLGLSRFILAQGRRKFLRFGIFLSDV